MLLLFSSSAVSVRIDSIDSNIYGGFNVIPGIHKREADFMYVRPENAQKPAHSRTNAG
jgi:hypothetical protein